MFAVLHVADFALQAVLRIERDLADRPVALLDETRRPPVVIACTTEARESGVETGLTASQAMARCPAIVLRNAQPAAEAEARAGLLAAAFSVSPHVEDTAPGVCTMEIGGLAAERRAPALHAAVAHLRALGLGGTAGLAATPLLALYAARWGATTASAGGRVSNLGGTSMRRGTGARPVDLQGAESRCGEHDSRFPSTASAPANTAPSLPPSHPALCHLIGDTTPLVPTVATAQCHLLGDTTRSGSSERAAAADGSASRAGALREIRPGDEGKFLAPLPLGVAEPPPETAAILANWGVHTLGELTALTKADVTQRLGPAGLALWERAAGEVTRPLRRIGPPQAFVAEIALEHEVETLEPLLFVLRRFIDRLALELRNAGFVAGEMTLALLLADDTAHTRGFRLPEPTAQEEILFRVLHTHLETLHTEASVRGLRLECHPTRPLARQQGLFDSALRDPYGFAETLGRVAAVVGADRVGTPVLENSHKPDAVTLAVPATAVPPMAEEGPHPPRGLPLRRYRAPQSATVELNGEAPAFVWTPIVAGAVRAVAGPWRGSGDWWDAARAWRREEWDVELAPGGLYRLLHTRDGWFVEGEYD